MSDVRDPSPGNGPAPARLGGAAAWAIWGLVALFYCYGFFQRVVPSVLVGDLMREFGVTAAILGNLSAFYFYAYASLQLPVGVMMDRWGPRRVLAAAAVLCGAGSLLFATAEGLTSAYAGRFLIGAGAGFAWVGALKVASAWFPPRRFALVTGLTLMLGMAGAVSGQAPLAAIVDLAGWRGTLFWAAIFAFALAGMIVLFVRGAPQGVDTAPGTDGAGLLTGLKAAFTRPQVWLMALFGGSVTATLLSFAGLWGVPYLMSAHGVARPVAALTTSMMLIGWAVGAPVMGWFSDLLGRRKPPMILGAAGAMATFAAAIYVPGLPLVVVQGLFLANGVFAGGMVICFATAKEHAPRHAEGAVLGLVNMSVMGTGAVFQPLLGWFLDLNWAGEQIDGTPVYTVLAYQNAFAALIGCFAVSLIAAGLVRETRCGPMVHAGEHGI